MKKAILKKLSLILPIFLSISMMAFSQRTITGTVMDDSGEALIGANIIFKGTTIGTATDIDGSYSIVVPEGTVSLEFSYTGYATKEVEVAQSKIVDVILEINLDVALSGELCCFCYGVIIQDEEYWFQETQKLLAEKAALKAANIEKRRVRRLERRAERTERRTAKKITKEWEEIQARIAGSLDKELETVENFTDSDNFINLQTTVNSALKAEAVVQGNLREIEVYPNPVAADLQILLEEPLEKDGIMEIYNAKGQVVKTELLTAQQTNFKMDVSTLNKGFYTLKIPNENSFKHKKIIKQ